MPALSSAAGLNAVRVGQRRFSPRHESCVRLQGRNANGVMVNTAPLRRVSATSAAARTASAAWGEAQAISGSSASCRKRRAAGRARSRGVSPTSTPHWANLAVFAVGASPVDTGQLVFAQLMEHLPWQTFRRIAERYGGNRRVREFSCANQFRCMAFAQLSYREGLRDIETCLRAQSVKLYHLGIRGSVARSTPADAGARLAHLRRVRPALDPHRAHTLSLVWAKWTACGVSPLSRVANP